jgi:hypothetical protein
VLEQEKWSDAIADYTDRCADGSQQPARGQVLDAMNLSLLAGHEQFCGGTR